MTDFNILILSQLCVSFEKMLNSNFVVGFINLWFFIRKTDMYFKYHETFHIAGFCSSYSCCTFVCAVYLEDD